MIKGLISTVCYLTGIGGVIISVGYMILTSTISHAWGASWHEANTGFSMLSISLLVFGIGAVLGRFQPERNSENPKNTLKLEAKEEELKRLVNKGKL